MREDPRSITNTAGLQPELLAWFARERRALPWREDRDPYRVWISEAMLQQTRVETVVPYYQNFLARFPNVAALAAAREEDVLAAWSGLGYYRRARSLRAAAEAIVRDHGGMFPRSVAELRALPGIGPYTAGAVASIAFDAPEALVDGNVARLLARWYALEGEVDAPKTREHLWELARALVPTPSGAGDWNQALMELGALVCLPREPLCATCPVARHCRAHLEQRTSDLPRKKPRRASVDVELLVLVIENGTRFLLEQRGASGRMSGLWQFPTLERGQRELLHPSSWPAAAEPSVVSRSRPRSDALTDCDAGSAPRPCFLGGEPLGEVRHTITHHRMRVEIQRGSLVSRAPPPAHAWFERSELLAQPLTGMTKKILRTVLLPAR